MTGVRGGGPLLEGARVADGSAIDAIDEGHACAGQNDHAIARVLADLMEERAEARQANPELFRQRLCGDHQYGEETTP